VSVLKVSRDRWLAAQQWELSVWSDWRRGRGWRRIVWPLARPLLQRLGSDRGAGDDWNQWWAEQFDRYESLPIELGEYIELGCGPYTNTRLILRGRRASRVVCSDPLADHYLSFSGRWLSEAAASGRIEVDSHPIEGLPFPAHSFDVVVLINVLDHVQDAERSLVVATELVRPGGYFVLGQDFVDSGSPDDLGHPIKLSETDVDPYLEGFEPLLRKLLPSEQTRNPAAHRGTLAFVGRKHG
jgi:SAM-dependent methyltransferase